MKKTLLFTSLLLGMTLSSISVSADSIEETHDPYNPEVIDPHTYLEGGTPANIEESLPAMPMPRSSQGKSYKIPGNQGTLTANVWRSTSGSVSGNTIQWSYQVSAVYSGSKKVESIRTTWKASASMRNSASISLGVSNSGSNASASSSWSTTSTKTKYWENNNGAKEASYRSNVVISPKKDYRTGTISVVNTAKVKLAGDKKTYEISAGV